MTGRSPAMDWPDVPAAVLAVSRTGARTTESLGSRPVAGDEPFRIASLTKTLTAAALVLELRARRGDLDVPVLEVLPELAEDWRADPAITVAHVLAQVSGLAERVDGEQAAAAGAGDAALIETARRVVRAGSDRRPGERWSCYNGNYFLAGAVLARLHGTSYEDAIAERLLRPWTLTRTGFTDPPQASPGADGSGPQASIAYPRARRPSGGLWSTADDLLGFAERLLAEPALLADIGGRRTAAADPMAYGLGWALGPRGQWYVNGRLPGYRAVLLLVPDAGLACVGLAAHQDALPLIAAAVNDVQEPLTGDDLTAAVVGFAA